jgi:hypothetical protein
VDYSGYMNEVYQNLSEGHINHLQPKNIVGVLIKQNKLFGDNFKYISGIVKSIDHKNIQLYSKKTIKKENILELTNFSKEINFTNNKIPNIGDLVLVYQKEETPTLIEMNNDFVEPIKPSQIRTIGILKKINTDSYIFSKEHPNILNKNPKTTATYTRKSIINKQFGFKIINENQRIIQAIKRYVK